MGLTNIQWCDYTFNAWLGCRKVAPECVNCYIVTTPPFRFRGITHGPQRIRTAESTWKHPLAWNHKGIMICPDCRADLTARLQKGSGVPLMVDMCKCGSRNPPTESRRPRVFCASLSDWLDDENMPIEWLRDLLSLIRSTPNLDWLTLTKRPQNWRPRLTAALLAAQDDSGDDQPEWEWLEGWLNHDSPPENVWIGVSAGADQAAALAIPARIHFLSCEPMLKPLDRTHSGKFDWIIFGGESGRGARPFDVVKLNEAMRFCRECKIPIFVKQMGANPRFCHDTFPSGLRVASGWADHVTFPEGHMIKLRDSHGGDMSEWPDHFRVREFPTLNPITS